MQKDKTYYKSYSKKQLTTLYKISDVTLKAWLDPINDKVGKYRGKAYSPSQVKIIFEFLGEPEGL